MQRQGGVFQGGRPSREQQRAGEVAVQHQGGVFQGGRPSRDQQQAGEVGGAAPRGRLTNYIYNP